MKQTWGKLRAHVVHVYIEYVCFMYASSYKRSITDDRVANCGQTALDTYVVTIKNL